MGQGPHGGAGREHWRPWSQINLRMEVEHVRGGCQLSTDLGPESGPYSPSTHTHTRTAVHTVRKMVTLASPGARSRARPQSRGTWRGTLSYSRSAAGCPRPPASPSLAPPHSLPAFFSLGEASSLLALVTPFFLASPLSPGVPACLVQGLPASCSFFCASSVSQSNPYLAKTCQEHR